MPSGLALEGDQLVQTVLVGARHAPGREAQAQGQYRLLLHRCEEPRYIAVPQVHDVRAGQSGGRHLRQEREQSGTALAEGGPGDGVEHQVHGRVLDEVTGGTAVGVADDLRALGERARSGDPGGLQRGRAGQGGVSVVEADEGGGPAQFVLDERAVDPPAREHVVVESPGDDPAVGPWGVAQGRPEFVDCADARQVGAGRHLQPPHGVAVRVDQAGDEGGSGEVDALRSRTAPRADDVLGVADGRDQTVPDGHGRRLR